MTCLGFEEAVPTGSSKQRPRDKGAEQHMAGNLAALGARATVVLLLLLLGRDLVGELALDELVASYNEGKAAYVPPKRPERTTARRTTTA